MLALSLNTGLARLFPFGRSAVLSAFIILSLQENNTYRERELTVECEATMVARLLADLADADVAADLSALRVSTIPSPGAACFRRS
jgi:hypothetical protein